MTTTWIGTKITAFHPVPAKFDKHVYNGTSFIRIQAPPSTGKLLH